MLGPILRINRVVFSLRSSKNQNWVLLREIRMRLVYPKAEKNLMLSVSTIPFVIVSKVFDKISV